MLSRLFSDFFDDPESWLVVASGQARGKLSCAKGPDGKAALRLDYDFHGGGGFVVIRKEIQFTLPETFEIGFCLHGEGPRNNFEFKITDPGGANAWRFLREDFQMPEDWTGYRIRERDLPFAWGPAGGGAPEVVGAVELVVAAGPGGSGSVYMADIRLTDETLYQPAETGATSHLPNHFPDAVFEPGLPSGWRAAADDPSPQWWVDFGRPTRFGGLVIDWPSPLPPRCYDVEISEDGETWSRIHHARRSSGRRSHIPAAFAEARYLRVNFGSAETAALLALDLQPDSFSHTPNEFIHSVAKDFPRGWFPRYWYREQSYWTPVGSPEGKKRGLINEEGLVETDEAGFSLEPFLLLEGKLVTWDDAEIQVSMEPGGLPLPAVTWTHDGVSLKILPWVDGSGENMALRVAYQIENAAGRNLRLAVAVRPFQVNPPWQAFRNLGGRSPIRQIVCDEHGMSVDGKRVRTNRLPEVHGAASFEEGGVVEALSHGQAPECDSVEDDSGLASGVMTWTVPQDTGSFHVTVSVPFGRDCPPPADDALHQALSTWQKALCKVKWDAPEIAREAVECFRTAAGHILINRDGAAIQPGPRRYTRSWVRDCVIMGAALDKAGHPAVLKDFLEWYAPFQREDGFIPCVVDRDGIDWLVEHDSHGQFIWGVREVVRSGGSDPFLDDMWPHVKKAAEYLVEIRKQRLTGDFASPDHACHGLLPESASHEGYLAHPVHSYWDDFWGIRGLEAATDLATAMEDRERASTWHSEAAAFLKDTLASIDRVIADRKLAYVPGSVEWADFDPTATANAIAQLDFADHLPAIPLHQMLDTYLEGFRKKHGGEIPWLNYTAYEIRIISAFVRMGKRAEAHELLEFFLSDRRPCEWNQWPEITWRDPRSPGHLGDVPHTWIAAEYMLALSSMVASEREGTEKMVLAAGLSWDWISLENGFSVSGLVTRHGQLDFHIAAVPGDRIQFSIGEGIDAPAGSLRVSPPIPPDMRIASASTDDDMSLEIDADRDSVIIPGVPMTATIYLEPNGKPAIA